MMHKRLIWILALAALIAYAASLLVILKPYFAKRDATVLWRYYGGEDQISYIHIGKKDTVFVAKGRQFAALSASGQELYRFTPEGQAAVYGYDTDENDSLYIIEMTGWELPDEDQSEPQYMPDGTRILRERRVRVFADLLAVELNGGTRFENSIVLNGSIHNLWVMQECIYFLDSSGDLHCYNLDGDWLWTRNYPGMSDFVTSDDGTLFGYVGSTIVALDGQGEILWESPLAHGAGIQHWTHWHVVNHQLYLLYNTNMLQKLLPGGQIAWDRKAGRKAYMRTKERYVKPSLTVDAGGRSYVINAHSVLTAFDTDGDALWHYRTSPQTRGVAVDASGMVYLQAERLGLAALTPRGKLKWRDPKLAGDGYVAPRTDKAGNLYVVNDNTLIAIDPR